MGYEGTVDLTKLTELYDQWLKDGATAGDLQLRTAYMVAEMSFKVGIREVVEEIEIHNLYEKKNSTSFYHGGISIETSESLSDRKWWQAFKNERGIE